MREVESFERTRTTQLFRHGAPGGARQKENDGRICALIPRGNQINPPTDYKWGRRSSLKASLKDWVHH